MPGIIVDFGNVSGIGQTDDIEIVVSLFISEVCSGEGWQLGCMLVFCLITTKHLGWFPHVSTLKDIYFVGERFNIVDDVFMSDFINNLSMEKSNIS